MSISDDDWDNDTGTLDVVELKNGFGLAYMWSVTGQGLVLGEMSDHPFLDGEIAEPSDLSREGWEHWVAHMTIKSLNAEHGDEGYFWESPAAARKALVAIKAKIKLGRDMPDWAKTAIENGWKAPRGWKP